MPSTCAVHTNRAAAYRCDGCHRLLCESCIQASHRLILCAHCGEMALPLAGGGPRTSTQLRQTGARQASYSLVEAFAYPFRGTGAGVFWVYFVLLAIFNVIPAFIPLAGCVFWIPSVVVALLVPRLLFTIVRTTAEGENELPDWPDFDFWARLIDAFAMALIGIVAAIPGIAIFWISGCDVLTLVGAGEGRSCWPPLVLAFFFGVAVWIPTLGATSVFDSFWLLPRLDLHVRALFAAPAEALVMTLVLAALLVGSWAIRVFAPVAIPGVGTVLAVFVGIYAGFMGAHLVGVYFRRHYEKLEVLYVG
jgi:hypothetical protein